MKYIFESPDKGKTVYRREFGNYNKREKMTEIKIGRLPSQERVVFGPNVSNPQQNSYANRPQQTPPGTRLS